MLTRKKKTAIRIAVMAALVLVMMLIIALVLRRLLPDLIPLLRAGDEGEIESYIRSFGSVRGGVITMFLSFIQVISIVFPGTPIWVAAGVVFGWWKGFLLCQAAFSASNVAVFVLSRKLHGKLDEIFVGGESEGKFRFMTDSDYPEYMVFLADMVPLVPNGAVPYIAARTDITTGRFAAAMTLGSVPQILAYCAVGNRILQGDWLFAGILFGGLLAVIIALYVFRERIIKSCEGLLRKRGKHAEPAPDADASPDASANSEEDTAAEASERGPTDKREAQDAQNGEHDAVR